METHDPFRHGDPGLDTWHMRRALELAARGRGGVEPNPMVGCVIARGAEIVGEGWHRKFGGPHAEREALALAGPRARGATLYVTLEPCSHQGKTPPCAPAVIEAGIARAVVAMGDPFPQVAGRGIQQIRDHGIQVDCGLLEAEARALNAPYLKLLATGRPWIIAKWAMTLDGKLASQDGHSQWISNERSRAVAHQLRGRVDAIIVGRRTAEIDDPLLTARPAGPRIATRIVLDSCASLAPTSQLVRTVSQAPVLVAASRKLADEENCHRLQAAGCEVLLVDTPLDSNDGEHREMIGKFVLERLLDTLGGRKMTNVLVEGGSAVLGSLRDRDLIDEAHVFISPRIMGGERAPPAVGGLGASEPATSLKLVEPKIEVLDNDVYIHGYVEFHGDVELP